MRPVLEFEDLLTARVVSKLYPELRGALFLLLVDRREGHLPRDVLWTLTERELINPEQLHGVKSAMARYRHGRALGIYLTLVEQSGLARASLDDHVRALGARANVSTLAADLVRRGLVSAAQDAQFRAEARVIFDRDCERQLADYLAKTQASREISPDEAEAAGSSTAELPVVGTAIFRLNEQVPTPARDEAALIVSHSGEGLGDLLQPPTFPIPDWVDTRAVSGGPLLIGDYRILGQIESDAASTVYLVHTLGQRDRPTALKTVRPTAPPDAVRRLERAALISSLCAHPRILDIYEAGEEEGTHFLAQEFFPGRTLEALLTDGVRFSPRQAITVVRMVVDALQALHSAHVIHRAISPRCVLIAEGMTDVRLAGLGRAHVVRLGGMEDRVFTTQSDAAPVAPATRRPSC